MNYIENDNLYRKFGRFWQFSIKFDQFSILSWFEIWIRIQIVATILDRKCQLKANLNPIWNKFKWELDLIALD